MGYGVDRDSLRRAAGKLREGMTGDTQGSSNPGPAEPPDAGRSTPVVTEVMAQAGMVAANANEMASRAARDMDQCAGDYGLNEQKISQTFSNLTGDLKGSFGSPPGGQGTTRAAGK